MARPNNIVMSFVALVLALAAAAGWAQPSQLRARPTASPPHVSPKGPVAPQIRPAPPNIPQSVRTVAPSTAVPAARVAPQHFSPRSPAVLHWQPSKPGRSPAPPDRVLPLQHAVPANVNGELALPHIISVNVGPSGRPSVHGTFQGNFANRFAGQRRHDRHSLPIVIGWIGPLFWPYAYDDFVDYTFYPYGYDAFWPYAYDDLYDAMFGQFAYSSRRATYATKEDDTDKGEIGSLDICGGSTKELTDLLIGGIAQAVDPDDAQRALLNELQAVTAKSLDLLKTGCARELPSGPSGRIEAMRARLSVMLQAVRTVRSALGMFYQSLSDEQKARFDAANRADDQDWLQAQQSPTRSCADSASGIASAPLDKVERAVQPDDAQRLLLGDLKSAMSAAVELLKSSCPTNTAITRVTRLEAVEQRLNAFLGAVEAVQPTLEKFYGSLNDEQKERFNRLGLGSCVRVIRQGKSSSVCTVGAEAKAGN